MNHRPTQTRTGFRANNAWRGISIPGVPGIPGVPRLRFAQPCGDTAITMSLEERSGWIFKMLPRKLDRGIRLRTSSCTPGFTLMELLIVISIIAIVSALALPTMNYMGRSNKVRSAVDSIQMAAAVSRAYVGLKDLGEGTGGVGDDFPGAGYQGTAIIFTPSNKIRFTYHDVTATNRGSQTPLQQTTPPKNGFADIEDRDPVKLSSEVGLLGIGNGRVVLEDAPSPVLLPPPFAVRFDVKGQLVPGVETGREGQPFIVYYDGNYDGLYHVDKTRGDTPRQGTGPTIPCDPGRIYSPANWTPGTPEYELCHRDGPFDPGPAGRRPGFNTTKRRYRLPFESLEAVVGVLVYDKAAFEATDLTLPGYIRLPADESQRSDVANWLTEHGRAVFFNRYSGTIIEKGPLALDSE